MGRGVEEKPNTSTSKLARTVIRIYSSQHCQERYMICRGLRNATRRFRRTTAAAAAPTNGLVCSRAGKKTKLSLYVILGCGGVDWVDRAHNRIKMFSLADDFVSFGRQSNYHTQ